MATQKEQPNWATPLMTIAPRLEQIALTHASTYIHSPTFTVRLRF